MNGQHLYYWESALDLAQLLGSAYATMKLATFARDAGMEELCLDLTGKVPTPDMYLLKAWMEAAQARTDELTGNDDAIKSMLEKESRS
ncbi:MAG: hypothetical protein LBP58_03070 [Azoarcus sp.]|jgi:hypothetical protein|nr:hypothetical protein [Azoarcus sp.]